MTVTVDKDNFEQMVSSRGIVLIDCWAPWCKACKDFEPVWTKVASRHEEHVFAKLNTQQEEALVSSLGLEHVPTLLLYRDGFLLFKQPGYYDEKGLEDILAQAASLDMEEVRAALSADNQQPSADQV